MKLFDKINNYLKKKENFFKYLFFISLGLLILFAIISELYFLMINIYTYCLDLWWRAKTYGYRYYLDLWWMVKIYVYIYCLDLWWVVQVLGNFILIILKASLPDILNYCLINFEALINHPYWYFKTRFINLNSIAQKLIIRVFDFISQFYWYRGYDKVIRYIIKQYGKVLRYTGKQILQYSVKYHTFISQFYWYRGYGEVIKYMVKHWVNYFTWFLKIRKKIGPFFFWVSWLSLYIMFLIFFDYCIRKSKENKRNHKN